MLRTIFVDLSAFDDEGKRELGNLIVDAGGIPKFAENSVELEDNDKIRLEIISILSDFNVEHRELSPEPEEPSNEALNRIADRFLDADEYDPRWLEEAL